MDLPVMPPVKPMLAKPQARIPTGMHYEAKWDGFRAIVFRDGDEIEIGSRTTKPLTRYFPELVEGLRANLPERCVVDGEIVIVRGPRLDFDALLERIHPADSRVRMLAERTPAGFVAFDLLALGDDALLDTPLSERRAALADALAGARPPVFVTPATTDVEVARQWYRQYEGAGLDGVIAKPLDLPYRPDERLMVKVKHERTADCVVAGLRHHKSGPVVGSLLLGLYDDSGRLQHVGVSAAFAMRRRQELMTELEPLIMDAVDDHPWADWAREEAHAESRMPGAPSRWTGRKDLTWVPLRPERVCEVAYDHMQGDRFRHTARFRRWRPDREPRDCTYEQLEEPVGFDLADVLTAPEPRR
ncbi:ATP-dependent DNA ligase [Streptomyces litchfieldiae]|uniref:DNA ligase (ATP) n=1 Tax=Streptomyces litchfieldiae TaxID=3075543 RepID=A0ABU2MRK5_9ACTN|nr:ATP-dependent DNA ligase [Streptomyces sp. DSM 44938]MDT0344253.1 ATP-dependent DNA ligase [Streptomyces sp. DSM 44938]